MKGLLAGTARGVGVDRQAGHPGQLLARENKRPRIPFLAWHARVYKDVLELSAPATALGSDPQTRPSMSQVEGNAFPKVSGLALVAAQAARNHELRLRPPGHLCMRLRRNDLHEVTHNTETQAARKIDAPPAPPGTRQAQHRFDMRPRQPWLRPSGVDVKEPHRFGRRGLRHRLQPAARYLTLRLLLRGNLQPGRRERSPMKALADTRPIAL
jgi:hypothetical protein